jgi:uncharacterized membrane protein SpoIIM required for sporulation
MIIESLINPEKMNKNISILFFIGFFYTLLSLFLSYSVFKEYSSIITILLTSFSLIPYIYKSIKYEEKEDLKLDKEISILKHHYKTLMKFMMIFLGMVLAFCLAFVFLPSSITDDLFLSQVETINVINPNLNENNNLIDVKSDNEAIKNYNNLEPKLDDNVEIKNLNNQLLTGNYLSTSNNSINILFQIITNNLVVIFVCFLFSFLFGFGSIFILSWNASVMGTAIGLIVKESLSKIGSLFGFEKIFHYFNIISVSFFSFFIHGFFEIMGYFVAGLAGGILSVAAIKHDFRTKKYKKILNDSFILFLSSLLLIILAGLIEVYVTPLFFY